MLMIHSGMLGIVVVNGNKENDVKSVASVLNEIGVGGLNIEVATDNATRPVLPKEIYKVEFWHAHLNYACLRASDAGLPGGGAARLAGDQLCHWNTLSPDAVFQATHLIVFLPPCLGAFVLSNHSSHNSAFFKFSSPNASASEGLTACVKQVANFPLFAFQSV